MHWIGVVKGGGVRGMGGEVELVCMETGVLGRWG